MLTWPLDEFADPFFDQELYETDAKFKGHAIAIFERDSFTCKKCGFQCDPSPAMPTAYFQTKAVDGNYRNLKSSNLETICPFCHIEYNMRSAAISGRYLPVINNLDLKQADLSLVCKAIFTQYTSNKNKYFDEAKKIYSELMSLTKSVAQIMPTLPSQQFTTTTDGASPHEKALANLLMNICFLAESPQSQNVVEFTSKILLLPIYDRFVPESAFWYESAYASAHKDKSFKEFLSLI